MSTMRPRVQAGIQASIEAYNRISGKHVRVEDSPFMGPRNPPLQTIDIGSEFPLVTGQTVQSVDLINGLFVGAHHYGPIGPCDRVLMRDVEFRNHKKWASRSYRMRGGNRIEYSSFLDVIDEHAIYWNLAGGAASGEVGFVITHCFFENVGSQAIQLVQRDHEQGFDFTSDCIPGKQTYISDTLFRNIGSGFGDLNRASFAISAFGRELQTPDGQTTLSVASIQQQFFIRNVVLDNSMQTAPLGKNGTTSHGALYIGQHPKAAVNGFIALMGITDRPVARFEGLDEIHVDGCFFHAEGGQAWIEFENCRKINVLNCTGNVQIIVRNQGVPTKTIDNVSKGYSQP